MIERCYSISFSPLTTEIRWMKRENSLQSSRGEKDRTGMVWRFIVRWLLLFYWCTSGNFHLTFKCQIVDENANKLGGSWKDEEITAILYANRNHTLCGGHVRLFVCLRYVCTLTFAFNLGECFDSFIYLLFSIDKYFSEGGKYFEHKI